MSPIPVTTLFIYNSNFCIDLCILFELPSSGHSAEWKCDRALAWWPALLSRGSGWWWVAGTVGGGRDREILLHRGWQGELKALSPGPHPQTHSDRYLTALSFKNGGNKEIPPQSKKWFGLPSSMGWGFPSLFPLWSTLGS